MARSRIGSLLEVAGANGWRVLEHGGSKARLGKGQLMLKFDTRTTAVWAHVGWARCMLPPRGDRDIYQFLLFLIDAREEMFRGWAEEELRERLDSAAQKHDAARDALDDFKDGRLGPGEVAE
jgi:hypothetical protein